MTLPEAITSVLPPDDRMRIATVVDIDPLTVSIEGTNVPAGALVSYTPVTGDTVAVIRQDSTWLILGSISPSTSGDPGGSPSFQAGIQSMTVTAASSATASVVFARPYVAVPAVATNINSGAGATALWGSRAINVTTAGFDLFIFAAAASSFTADVQWQAQAVTQL